MLMRLSLEYHGMLRAYVVLHRELYMYRYTTTKCVPYIVRFALLEHAKSCRILPQPLWWFVALVY